MADGVKVLPSSKFKAWDSQRGGREGISAVCAFTSNHML